MMLESSNSEFFWMISQTSSAIKLAFSPVMGSTYSWRSFMVSVKDFFVALCKLLTAMRLASWA